jgi:hypothetical protein
MSISAFITMIVVLGTLWGGFLIVLTLAVKKEKKKGQPNDKEWKK